MLQADDSCDLHELEHFIEGICDAGVGAFKEVARQSTHTILAACRSEHQKSDTVLASSVCSHWNDIQQFHRSTMPNCCRQCFYMFVKNVVNSIMLQKVGCSGSSCGTSL